MKRLFTFLFIIILVLPFAGFCQEAVPVAARKDIVLHGVIIDQDSKLPLAYTSVGIVNKPVGTVSDTLGRFDLAIGNEYLTDSLLISMIGYYPVKKSIRELIKLSEPMVISLAKKIILLNEVVVSDKFKYTEIIGRQSNGSLLQASIIPKGSKAPVIGAESGLKIQAKHYPALLDYLNFFLSRNNFKHIKFRLNFYSLKNNLPDTLLLNKEILVSLDNYKTGWTKIDLSPYNIVLSSDYAITFQWVDYNRDMTNEPQVLLPAGISFSHINYFRTASQDKWSSVKGTVSIYITQHY